MQIQIFIINAYILFVQYVYAKVNHLEKVFGKAFYLLEI